MIALSRYVVKRAVVSSSPLAGGIFTSSSVIGTKQGPLSLFVREFGRGQGDAGGWPSSTGHPSGGGRSNYPPKNSIEKGRDARGRRITYSLYSGEHVDKCFDEQVTSIACGGKATIMLYENGGTAWTKGLTTNLCNKLNEREKSLPKPEYVAMGSQDRYYVSFTDGESAWVGCDELTKKLRETNKSVKSVAFGEDWDSFFVVFDGGGYAGRNVPSELHRLLNQRDKADLECVSLGPKGEYYISVQSGKAWWGGTSEDNLERIRKVKDRVTFIDFADDNTFLCRYT